MMDVTELRAYLDRHFTRAAFRLEALQTYEVASDGSDYRRYLDGEPEPTWSRKQPWLDHLAAERAAGLDRHRVRIITHPVTPYTRYACEWGYALNGPAGEGIRILDLGEHGMPSGDHLADDFWLITDNRAVDRVLVMHYAVDGQYLGATERPDLVDRGRATRDALWVAAEPFAPWWSRHTELHRDPHRAA